MMTNSPKLLLAVSLLASLTLTTVAFPAEKKDSSSVVLPTMTPKLTAGKLVYDAKCGSCHGKNVVGTNKGPTFLHRVYHPGHRGDAAFFLAARRGARAHHWRFGDMPPVVGIKDAEIENVIWYVRALQKANGIF